MPLRIIQRVLHTGADQLRRSGKNNGIPILYCLLEARHLLLLCICSEVGTDLYLGTQRLLQMVDTQVMTVGPAGCLHCFGMNESYLDRRRGRCQREDLFNQSLSGCLLICIKDQLDLRFVRIVDEVIPDFIQLLRDFIGGFFIHTVVRMKLQVQ